MSNLEMITLENAVLVLIDFQPAMFQSVESHDRLSVMHNVQVLVKGAKLFGLPTVIFTVAKDSFSGPLMPEVTDLFPDHEIVDLTSINSWLDANFRAAVEATGRKKIVLAGLWTEDCVMFPTLDLLHEGYEVISQRMPLAAWTDATRVSSYNPWLTIYWAVSGKGRCGEMIWTPENRVGRHDAPRDWTAAGAWFSREEGKKGQTKDGQFADIAVLDRDYFSVAEDEITEITSDLTLIGGKIVHAKGAFGALAPTALPELPDWSPVPVFGHPGFRLNVLLWRRNERQERVHE